MVQRIYAAHNKQATSTPCRSLHLHFLRSPVAAVGGSTGHLASVELQHNALHADAAGDASVVATAERSTVPVQLLIKSVGSRGVPLPGVPFDHRRGIVPSVMGRVIDTAQNDLVDGPDELARVGLGLYVCGWLKRGPQGIIGSNLMDAQETASAVADDAAALLRPIAPPSLPALLKVRCAALTATAATAAGCRPLLMRNGCAL
jgi:NADPH-dependent glutamate synthase beta subunit-like oxidoreductase